MDEPKNNNDIMLNTALVGDIDENKVCRLGQKFYLRVWLSGGEGLYYAVDHVDVMALCSSAEVAPSRKRLSLPPVFGESAEFSVRPDFSGDAKLRIVLLIGGERIQESELDFTCE